MIDPQDVQSPKRHLALVSVLVNSGLDGYSVALVRWDGAPKLAMRWNGTDENPIGNPQSRGLPTWFVVPDEFIQSTLAATNGNGVPIVPAESQALARNFFAVRNIAA